MIGKNEVRLTRVFGHVRVDLVVPEADAGKVDQKLKSLPAEMDGFNALGELIHPPVSTASATSGRSNAP